jgi:hypothetical protein
MHKNDRQPLAFRQRRERCGQSGLELVLWPVRHFAQRRLALAPDPARLADTEEVAGQVS